jgi:hypothetical protein
MGTSFTVDTAMKVAKYGISSVLSIGDDYLCEEVRKYYCEQNNFKYTPINMSETDYRPRRIMAYLNLIKKVVKHQINDVKNAPFKPDSEIIKYFELLPEESQIKKNYLAMTKEMNPSNKKALQEKLRESIAPGAIDVNIMTKVDRTRFDKDGQQLPIGTSDALTAFQGFAQSDLNSSIVLSAGFNMRLYSYINNFKDFLPDENGQLKKRVILKVSDYRSALIQGKFLAKNGIWVSEFRIESGLNCGGHAFISPNGLLGPILEEFKNKKEAMAEQLLKLCNNALKKNNTNLLTEGSIPLITVQGGIGTSDEANFLRRYYNVDATGWASPFLLVPEAVVIDDENLKLLISPERKLYLSGISPIGIPFNTIRNTKSEQNKLANINSGTPGSPCPKGFLSFSQELSKNPICLASKLYQKLKIAQLKSLNLKKEEFTDAYKKIVEKVCLCEDLAASFFLKYKIPFKRQLNPAVCPGPNLAYFSKICSLKEMIDHIYGRISVLNDLPRPHVFMNELKLNIDYYIKEVKQSLPELSQKQVKYLNEFKQSISDGIEYYKKIIPEITEEAKDFQQNMIEELASLKEELELFFKKYQLALA